MRRGLSISFLPPFELGKGAMVLFAGGVGAKLPDAVGGKGVFLLDFLQKEGEFRDDAEILRLALFQEYVHIYVPIRTDTLHSRRA